MGRCHDSRDPGEGDLRIVKVASAPPGWSWVTRTRSQDSGVPRRATPGNGRTSSARRTRPQCGGPAGRCRWCRSRRGPGEPRPSPDTVAVMGIASAFFLSSHLLGGDGDSEAPRQGKRQGSFPHSWSVHEDAARIPANLQPPLTRAPNRRTSPVSVSVTHRTLVIDN